VGILWVFNSGPQDLIIPIVSARICVEGRPGVRTDRKGRTNRPAFSSVLTHRSVPQLCGHSLWPQKPQNPSTFCGVLRPTGCGHSLWHKTCAFYPQKYPQKTTHRRTTIRTPDPTYEFARSGNRMRGGTEVYPPPNPVDSVATGCGFSVGLELGKRARGEWRIWQESCAIRGLIKPLRRASTNYRINLKSLDDPCT
jgi:hypothetical protein